ncbi:MAG: phosphopantothenoylcysteine synthase [Spirochaetaceae bacterium]|nr:phosphopantothenoylcysteine synthase [Spirochaetaceae bacterium]
MDYLVTGGGTEERIDGVRSITNFATGRLGALIAERLSRQRGTETVFYVHGKRAVCPQEHGGTSIRLIEVEGVSDLEAAVRRVLAEHEIGAIVHSMAVSDYTVDRVLDGSGREITARDKIASSERELRLILKPTPKIIGLFHELSPESALVGFKLLNNVSEAALTEAAFALLEKNHCACVLANDLAGITAEKHAAFLIDKRKNITRFAAKAEIAEGICRFLNDYRDNHRNNAEDAL